MKHESYPGGKAGSGVYQTIINQIPPHQVYIEPFLGGGAIMRMKRAAVINIGIDMDPEVIKQAKSSSSTGSWSKSRDAGVFWRFLCQDGIRFLARYRYTGSEFIYCDPPYLPESRSCQRRIYRYELTPADHYRLLRCLLTLPCAVMVSGYWTAMYGEVLSSWRVKLYPAVTRRGRRVVERIWMNYPEPTELHDYSYLGDGYRERERIRKKVNRWVRRLEDLPVLERAAVLTALRARAGTA
jgi:DNA adenine methylase